MEVVNLDNLSKRFWKALDLISKLPEHERLTLCTLLTTVDHSNPKSETTYKTNQFYDVKCFNNAVEDKGD